MKFRLVPAITTRLHTAQTTLRAKALTTVLTTVWIAASVAALTVAIAVTGAAQAAKTGSPEPPDPSTFDLYGGYAYFNPKNSDINNYRYEPINPGAVLSATGYFNRYLGLQAEGSLFPNGPNDCVYTAQAGPVLRYPRGRFVPFAHALGGGAKVGGPVFQPCTWGYGITSGIGFDYILPYFNNRLALRPIQADFAFSHLRHSPLGLPAAVSGSTCDIHT